MSPIERQSYADQVIEDITLSREQAGDDEKEIFEYMTGLYDLLREGRPWNQEHTLDKAVKAWLYDNEPEAEELSREEIAEIKADIKYHEMKDEGLL